MVFNLLELVVEIIVVTIKHIHSKHLEPVVKMSKTYPLGFSLSWSESGC
jgi:hypothetical protein